MNPVTGGPSVDYITELMRSSLGIAVTIAGPFLIAILVVGVVVSVVQVVTQIQEQTLTFVPKLAAVALIMVVSGGWMLTTLASWITALWTSIPDLLR
jgi:flagellar biosynthetic protein FliQ